MKYFLCISLFLLSTNTSAATRRLTYSPNFSCQEIQKLVRDESAVIIYQNPELYDRLVVNGSYCLLSQRTKPGYVKSRDTDSCLAGYVCRSFNR
jgi:hypothetical protein